MNIHRGILTAVTAVLAALAMALVPVASAETVIVVGGTRPPAGFADLIDGTIGPPATFPDADNVIYLDYPASAWPFTGLNDPTLGESVAIGADQLEAAIMSASGPITVIGVSQGSLVADEVQSRLEDNPNAPQDITFRVVAAQQHGNGIFTFVPDGTYIPILDYTVRKPGESRYDTEVIVAEYDGWADFPDRPWNLIATANALLGALYVHPTTPLVPPPGLEPVSVTTNSKGATTTIYLVPTKELPLTRPLRDLGVPSQAVNTLDKVLRPIVDAGYSRNDKPRPKRDDDDDKPQLKRDDDDKPRLNVKRHSLGSPSRPFSTTKASPGEGHNSRETGLVITPHPVGIGQNPKETATDNNSLAADIAKSALNRLSKKTDTTQAGESTDNQPKGKKSAK